MRSSFQAMGRAKPSFVGHALQNIDASGDISLQETIISESAGTAYGGKTCAAFLSATD